MSFATCTTIVGVFNGRFEADRAVDNLGKAGFINDQIGVESRDPQGKSRKKKAAAATHAAAGAVAGAVAGASIGGLVGLGVLAGFITVIGPTIATGTLATIVTNVAGGATIAGFAGAVIGRRIPTTRTQTQDSHFQAERVLVTVHAEDRWETAHTIIESHGGYGPQSAATSRELKYETSNSVKRNGK